MIEVGGRIVLAAVLVAASVAKLASPRSSSAALSTFGIRGNPRSSARGGPHGRS
ncbi:MAG TPA: hypothetical protein VE401_04195 [Solirubrobacterales bacterium]|jgi:hypothetical protein|nr:hypothetical protein [Solirubrobacterales bacterium]